MKVIDLKKRTIYVDDIEQIYCDSYYYTIQTKHGTFYVDSEDFLKVKKTLLSLNDEKNEEKEEEIERLNNIIEKLEQENAVLKTLVVNKDSYTYGIRMGSDKE